MPLIPVSDVHFLLTECLNPCSYFQGLLTIMFLICIRSVLLPGGLVRSLVVLQFLKQNPYPYIQNPIHSHTVSVVPEIWNFSLGPGRTDDVVGSNVNVMAGRNLYTQLSDIVPGKKKQILLL